MAIVFSYNSASGRSEGRPTHCICDTSAELPASMTIGDTAYCKQTGYFYKATATDTWTNQGGGEGAAAFSDLTGTASVAQGGTGASNAGEARTALGLGSLATQSGTFSGTSSNTNTGDVTLSGTPDYITISGQVITRGEVDLASDITGTLSVARGGTGQSNAGSARTALGIGDVGTLNTNASTVNFLRGDGTWVTPSSSVAASDITGSISLLTQSGQLRLVDGVTGTLSVSNGGTGGSSGPAAYSNLGLMGASNLSGTVAMVSGGTGASNAASARTNLGLGSLATASSIAFVDVTGSVALGAQSGLLPGPTGISGLVATANIATTGWKSGYFFKGDQTWDLPAAGSVAASDVTGSLSLLTQSGQLRLADGVTGTLAIVNGGTGQANANSALNTLLPSQVGNSGKYLTTNATDASWGTAPSPFTTVIKTGVDQGVSGTTLQGPVNQMDFTLISSTNYVFEYWIRYQTAANTTGLVLGLQTAQTPVGLWMNWQTPLASTGTVTGGSAIGSNTTLSIASGNISSGGVQLAYLTGMIMGGATGGTLSLKWCSEVTGSMCTIKTGSMGRIMSIT